MHRKSTILKVTSLVEIGAGILLLVDPSIAVRWLLGVEIAGPGIIISRIAAIALLSLGVACWPARSAHQPIYGMLTYGILVMVYLIVVGTGGTAGVLLWPAVVAHAILSVLLFIALRRES